MTLGAPTNVENHVTTNIACARSQRYTKDSVFWLAQMMWVIALRIFPPFMDQTSFQVDQQWVVDTPIH